MSDVLLVWRPDGLNKLSDDEMTSALLQQAADRLAKRVQVPPHLHLNTRSGEGPQGSYSQVRMFGPGAIFWEFGTRTRPAHAPLRKAMRSSR